MDSSQQEPPAASPSPKVRTRKRIAARRCKWLTLTWLLTWWIPSIFLYYCGRMKLRAVREAWREKVAICILIFLASCSLLFLLIGFGPVICPKQAVYSAAEVNGMQDKSRPLVYAYGRVFSVSSLLATHETGYGIQSYQFDALLGSDVSNLFYKHNLFKQYCPGLPSPSPSWDSLANRPKTVAYSHKAIDPSTGVQKMYLEFMNQYAVARIVWPLSYIAKVASAKNKIIVIGRNVYDVNSYFNSNIEFLGPSVKALFANFYGKDATAQWMQIARQNPQQADSYLNCMNNLFYIGTLDQRESFQCQAQDYVLLSFTSILCVVIVAKFIAAIRFVGESSPEKFENFVIINIPVYSEGVDSIQGTLESIANTDYEHSKKLLFIIADGMVTGSGNDRPTFQVLMDILGVEGSLDSYPGFQYESLGEDKDMVNRAVVISGFYTPSESKCLPFIAVVKVGNEDEIGPSAGNRGKRDSQLILLRFLSRCHFEDFMSPLEICIRSKLQNDLDVDPNQLEFLLMVDADTTVEPNSINQMVATMVHDQKIIGLCGETLIANVDGWITMIQVYEYFISHHLAKAFESMFGSVTCLPGCFCFYRLRSLKNKALIISPTLLKEYARDRVFTLHQKNLLSLGEDRYLTTLVLKSFPYMKTCFNGRAKCKTIVPDQWSVLLSQRRRWINSTVHNLWELMSVKQLCGCFCFSMRFVIMMDFISTILQPASILYIGYLIYVLVTESNSFPLISIIMLAGAYGLQILILIVKQEFSMIGWMIVYLLAMPVTGFLLPLYAFWHFDDFSWGKTRNIEEEEEAIFEQTERKHIQMTKFDDYRPIAADQLPPAHSKVLEWSPSPLNEEMESLGILKNPPKPASIHQQHNPRGSSPSHRSFAPSTSSSRSASFYSASIPAAPSSYASRRSAAVASPRLISANLPPTPSTPTDAEILAELRCLLSEANLQITSRKQIRLALQEKFHCDLKPKMSLISDAISTYIQR